MAIEQLTSDRIDEIGNWCGVPRIQFLGYREADIAYARRINSRFRGRVLPLKLAIALYFELTMRLRWAISSLFVINPFARAKSNAKRP